MHYLLLATVDVDERKIYFKRRVSFKTYNPMKPVKFGLKMFAQSEVLMDIFIT
jgi:hypothetical protein